MIVEVQPNDTVTESVSEFLGTKPVKDTSFEELSLEDAYAACAAIEVAAFRAKFADLPPEKQMRKLVNHLRHHARKAAGK